jgi:aspartyl-tRNA(Asn)/glutamyl-tRNA(Gln) amidotransferase subunit C
MALTPDEIDHLATLARLRLTPEERAELQRELGNILDYVAKLGELDLSAVPPMSHVDEAGTPLRPDGVTPSPVVEAILAAVPARSGRFVRVPRVIG